MRSSYDSPLMVLGILVRDHISWYPKRYTSDSHVSFRFSPTILHWSDQSQSRSTRPRVSLFSTLNRTLTPFLPRHVVHGSRLLSNDALPTHHDARRRRFRTSAIIASVKHVHYKSLSIDHRSQRFLLYSCVQFSLFSFLPFFLLFWQRYFERDLSQSRLARNAFTREKKKPKVWQRSILILPVEHFVSISLHWPYFPKEMNHLLLSIKIVSRSVVAVVVAPSRCWTGHQADHPQQWRRRRLRQWYQKLAVTCWSQYHERTVPVNDACRITFTQTGSRRNEPEILSSDPILINQ